MGDVDNLDFLTLSMEKIKLMAKDVFKMNQEELFQKVKEMIKGGNFDGAKRFIEEHKEQLGPYKEKAQNLLKDVNIDSVKDKFKNLFNK